MSARKFAVTFAESLEDLVRNYWVIFAGLIIFVAVFGMSKLGLVVAPNFQTTTSNVVWTVIYFLVVFAVGSFILSGMIAVAGKIVRGKKTNWKDLVEAGKKYWFWNLLAVLVIWVAFNGINVVLYLFRGLMTFFSSSFVVSANTFRNLSFLLGFAYLIAFFIFFTFIQFFIVLKDRKIWGAIKDSWHFVKMNYLETLTMVVIFFVIFRLLMGIGGVAEQLIVYGLALPYLAFLWTRFVLQNKK